MASTTSVKPQHGLKRFPPNSIKIQRAGDLVLARCTDRSLSGLFRRYEALFEACANMPVKDRLLLYRFVTGLILTSHAKKMIEPEEKKRLFDLKNQMFLRIANDMEARRKVNFRYLVSKNFRVTKFCDECMKRNKEQDLARHSWKFCQKCEVDRNFYNVLSMHHKFDEGSATLFLSNDLISQVERANLKKKGKLEETKEEALFQRYHYNVRNLDAFELSTTLDLHKRLMLD